MSNSELSTEYRQSADALPSSELGDDRADLKIILDAIAAQLSDADRRHSATLNEMQDRIAGMERETETLRPRVPEQFAPAFERIGTGVAELAQRLASASNNSKADTPMALRSAHESNDADARRREEEESRWNSGVDTFDVIESSVPGNVADPWDRVSAEALTDLYESGLAHFGSKSSFTPPAESDARAFAPGSNAASNPRLGASHTLPAIDQTWLENRFAEITKGLEQSLADIRPDHGFYAIGQRLDQFEQQFAKMFQGVATQADLAAIRLIEAHISEVADHLVQTQDQLARLNVIEDQLAGISRSLAEVQNGAPAPDAYSAMGHAAATIDIDAIARAAAEETAQRFAEMRPVDSGSAADELRPLIESLMAESRQGDENTAALLDTMQHAMIRLLDRVDSIEFAQQQSHAPQPGLREYLLDEMPFGADERPFGVSAGASAEDAPVAAASANAMTSLTPERGGALDRAEPHDFGHRKNEKLRQDFIAEARRAKMRLSASEQGDEILITPAGTPTDSALTDPGKGPEAQGNRPIRPPAATVKSTGPSGPSPRLILVAFAAIAALSGLWYSIESGHDKPISALPAVMVPSSAPSQASEMNGAASPASSGQSGNVAPGGAEPSSDGLGRRGEASPLDGSEGRIVPSNAPAQTTTLPMLGVALDTTHPVTEADLQLANRHQAMATMSGQIADAVAKARNPTVVPASMIPTEGEITGADAPAHGDGIVAPNNVSRSTPLDMPAATVGPLSLRLAAANGDPSAEFEVGARLAEGKGTTQNFKEAAKWYQLSADHDFAQAQYRLGTLYERGLGLKPDRALAATWYQRAAEQGNVKAMHNLAVLSADQSDQSPDYATAAHWFEEAAKRGLADSQFNLAVLYENGLGVTRDMKQAFVWLSLAARDGDKEAVRRRDILRGKLTAEETAAAEQMIRDWKLMPSDRGVNDALTAGEAWKKNPKNGLSG
jgi:localization factor PodJL